MGKLINQFNGGIETAIMSDTDKLYKRNDSEPSANAKDQFITWASFKNAIKAMLHKVAATGSYTDLIDTPTIPAAQVNSDWTATTGIGVILNKPSLQTNSQNFVSNGDFKYWGYGTSFTNPTSGAAIVDNWVCGYDGTGATRIFSRVLRDVTSVNGGGSDSPYWLRIQQTVAGSGGTFNHILQTLGGVRLFAGQTVTVKFKAKASSSIVLRNINLRQSFGSGGSASVDTFALVNQTITTTEQDYSVQVNVPSISGKTIGSSGDSFSFIPGLPINSTFDLYITDVVVVIGSTVPASSQNIPILSSSAGVTAGDRSDTYISPKTLYDAFNAGTLGTRGYINLPGGTILQYGYETTGAGSPFTLNFPIAFPNGCKLIIATDTGASRLIKGVTYLSTSQFRLWTSVNPEYTFWFAIGN